MLIKTNLLAKFKVGDWITDGHLICKVLSVTDKSYELHLYNDNYCHFETDVKSIDKYYHLMNSSNELEPTDEEIENLIELSAEEFADTK